MYRCGCASNWSITSTVAMQLGTITHWISWRIMSVDSNTERNTRFVLTYASGRTYVATEEKKCSDATATSWYFSDWLAAPMSPSVDQMVEEKDSK